MYVCICKGITEEMINKLKGQGHGPKEAMKRLGVGSDCGVCIMDYWEKTAVDPKNTKAPQAVKLT